MHTHTLFYFIKKKSNLIENGFEYLLFYTLEQQWCLEFFSLKYL
jgi:hypothetical protein